MQLDLMRTYNASDLPGAVEAAVSGLRAVPVHLAEGGGGDCLTGAIVGELPTGAVSGIGARLLQGSYYGQTVQIWAALFVGSFIAAGLVWLVGVAERFTLKRMGAKAVRKWQVSDILYPALFGIGVLVFWQAVVKGFNVPAVLLPAPSDIGTKFMSSLPILWVDFVQTVIRAVIPGWIIGSLSGFLVAILCDRIPFLRRGLLPLGNLVAALPIVGVAPILVMWFGFDWQSKAAMVVVMTFFPMLINAVAGLQASGTWSGT
jgi:NitT/TauT family transport system permease protein